MYPGLFPFLDFLDGIDRIDGIDGILTLNEKIEHWCKTFKKSILDNRFRRSRKIAACANKDVLDEKIRILYYMVNEKLPFTYGFGSRLYRYEKSNKRVHQLFKSIVSLNDTIENMDEDGKLKLINRLYSIYEGDQIQGGRKTRRKRKTKRIKS